MPQIKVNHSVISEADAYADLVFSLTAPSQETVSFDYSYGSGTSTSESDFPTFSGTLNFAPGETSKTLRLAVYDDNQWENRETFLVKFVNPVNATLERTSITVGIHDNDAPAGIPAISVGDIVVDEKSGLASFVVTLDKPANADVSVAYATSLATNSPIGAEDFVPQSGSLVFRAGETSKTINIVVNDDNFLEASEVFNLALSNASGGVLAAATAQALIEHNDGSAVAVPQIQVAHSVISEMDAYADVVLNLSGASTQAVSVNYSYGSGSSTSESDFPTFNGTIRFAPGEMSKTVRIPVYNDSQSEYRESFLFHLASPVNASLERTTTIITIDDNDAASGVPVVAIANTMLDEKSAVAQFVVNLDKPSTGNVVVAYRTQDGSAKAGSDFLGQSGSLVFRAGETSKTISVLVGDDVSAESLESFSLVLSNPSGASLGDATGLAVIGASDNPVAALPQIHLDNTIISEGDGYADMLVSLNAPSAQEVQFSYNYSSGTSTSESDFPTFSGKLAFAPGETAKLLRIPVYNDNSWEYRETLYVSLSAPVNASLERSSAAISMIDNDATGLPAISVLDSVVDEKAGIAYFHVVLDKSSTTSNVSVPFATVDGSAIAGSDYEAQSGTLVFRPYETVKTVAVLLRDDSLQEVAERFHLQLGTPTGASLADGVGTVQIAASDMAVQVLPQIQVGDISISEADGFADVVFSISAASEQVVSVSYSSGSGTSTSSSDFASFSGTISFAPGETSKSLRVAVYGDNQAEAQETFLVKLSNPVNASLERSSANVGLVDSNSGFRYLHYGMGNDIYEVTASSDRVAEEAGGGTDLVRFTMADYSAPANVENLQGNSQNNSLNGNELANQLQGMAGNDGLNGGNGIDTAVLSGNRSNYTIAKTATGFTVTDNTGAEGVDTLANIERVKFADATLALDSSGAGGQAYRVYQAAFNRTPDASGLGFWISVLDSGASMKDVANGFVASAEYKALYGSNPTNAEIVSKYYENVLHRTPDSGGYNFWLGVLDNGFATKAEVLASFSESPENQSALATVIGNGFVYTPFV